MSFLDFDDNDQTSNPFLLSSSSSLTADDAKSASSRDARDAVDEEALLKEFKQNPKAALALAESYAHALKAPRQPMTEITPIPGFVLQTQTTKESNKVPMISKDAQQTAVVFPKDTAVFINICHSDQMPKPAPASEAEIRKAVNAEEGATYQVPFQLSPPREYRDSLSRRYLVLDACIHTEPFKRTEKDFDYKLYIMELAMEWVEEKCRIELSRDFQLPDIKSKDELKKRAVILPKPPAIQEMDDWNPENATGAVVATTTAVAKSTTKTKSKDDGPTFVPAAGKDDIPLKPRLLPCPNGTKGIIVEIDLPNHRSMDGVTLDVVLPDRLVLHSKSQGQDIDQGKEYHVEVDLPNEPVDPDAVRAEFNKATKTLRIYTIKKARK